MDKKNNKDELFEMFSKMEFELPNENIDKKINHKIKKIKLKNFINESLSLFIFVSLMTPIISLVITSSNVNEGDYSEFFSVYLEYQNMVLNLISSIELSYVEKSCFLLFCFYLVLSVNIQLKSSTYHSIYHSFEN